MENRFRAVQQKPNAGAAPFRTLRAERDEEAFDFRSSQVRGNGAAKIASSVRRCLAFMAT